MIDVCQIPMRILQPDWSWKNGPENNRPGTNFFNENFGPGTEKINPP